MEQNFSLLNRLIPHLILNYHFVLNAGLLNGKMGGVVFFGQYARYTGKSYFRAYAEELLDEVFDMVHENVPIDFVNGLCGIGWGIEYLLCHSLPDTSNVCKNAWPAFLLLIRNLRPHLKK